MFSDGALQLLELHAGAWVRRDFNRAQSQRLSRLQHTKECRAFDGNQIAGTSYGPERQIQCFHAAGGNYDIGGREFATELQRVAGNLAAQRLGAGRKIVSGAVMWKLAQHLGGDLVQAVGGIEFRSCASCTQRETCRITRGAHDLVQNLGNSYLRWGIFGPYKTRLRGKIGKRHFDVKTGLWASLDEAVVFQPEVGLKHG